jgi:O-succinylbenzoate synthase
VIDKYNLVMVGQLLAFDDLHCHAKLQAPSTAPVYLDESIKSLENAKQAIGFKACKCINVKPGRVGGAAAAKQIRDLAQEGGAQEEHHWQVTAPQCIIDSIIHD